MGFYRITSTGFDYRKRQNLSHEFSMKAVSVYDPGEKGFPVHIESNFVDELFCQAEDDEDARGLFRAIKSRLDAQPLGFPTDKLRATFWYRLILERFDRKDIKSTGSRQELIPVQVEEYEFEGLSEFRKDR